MIKYIEGDIFTSPAKVLVNTVNTMGVMGKGIALEFKTRYPEMFAQYKEYCDKKKFVMGQLMLYRGAKDHDILLFPTKENWRNPSKLEYIEVGLKKFIRTYIEKGITSIAFPRLGCGNGELNWDDVKELMERYLNNLNIDIYVYTGRYDDSFVEHQRQQDMQNWFHDNAKDMSNLGVVDEIIHTVKLDGLKLKIGDKEFKYTYANNELGINNDEVAISFSNDELIELWENVCASKLLLAKNQSINNYVYELLAYIGYLTKVKIFNKEENVYELGYQLNEGVGRAY